MRTRTIILLTVAAILGADSPVAAGILGGQLFARGGSLTPDDLRCEYLVDPLGVDEARPRLSWIVRSSQRGQKQSAYRILVASSKELIDKKVGDLWDSGMVASDQTAHVAYAGKPLQSQMPCFWVVRVWDKDGDPSSWSKVASWSMGLLKPEDWRAQWIGFDASRKRGAEGGQIDLSTASWIWYPEGDATAGVPVGNRLFRREFDVPQGAQIESAACAVTADNWYKLYVNGRPVRDGGNFKEALVVDVKDNLAPGKNVIAIDAANQGDSANPAGVLAVLNVQYSDGSSTVIVSDDSWRTAQTGPTDWMTPDFDAGAWEHAAVAAAYGAGPWGEIKLDSAQLFLPPAQLLRKRFVLEKPVKRATVYASALGDYRLYLNGRQVGDAYFTPGWTDYRIRVYYNTFDVTKQLQKGFNAMGAMLADGWYGGYIGWYHVRDHYGTHPRFAAQLVVEHTDGSVKVVTTDGSWKATTGPILEGDFLMGETYDARKEIPDWSGPELDESQWSGVDVTDRVAPKLESHPGVLVRRFGEIKPVAMTEPSPGAFVFDMGTNFAGFARLTVEDAQPGQKIVLRFAERLNPDGTIYTTNLRGARATDTYICKGLGKETWQPEFTFHGFQYVEVTGYPGQPRLSDIRGIELTSDTPVVGRFECSDETANTLYHNICQTQRANFIEVPTDCPQRDERLGWMGDAQVYVRAATYNTDVASFFTKWLVDVEDAQLPNGAFTDVSPRLVAEAGGTAAWGDAGVICPWTIYEVYGDKRVLAEHYDAMTKWIDYCQGATTNLLRPAQGYGDWLSIQADTPKDVLATAYFAYSTKLVAQAAEVLGKHDDAAKYRELFEAIKRSFNDAYVGADGRIKGNTQTVYVLALAFDLLSEERQAQAVEYLVDDIRIRNWHLSTGFVGTKDLMATLTRFGRTNVAFALFHNKTFPSWGFSIEHGATSIWERWDGWTPEKGFQDPGMNSFAHYSFGAVAEWMFKTIGGIDTDGPAYKRIVIRPRPDGRLAWAKTSYDSIGGEIATSWKIRKATYRGGWDLSWHPLIGRGKGITQLSLDVTIPANTTAIVYVPTADAAGITEGGRSAMDSPGVQFVGTDGDNAMFEIGSGRYSFKSEMP
ncbi:MAG: family 78 glycoside hydrolase catalytic domain [Phycisphaerae bacterium]|nr:family 78 glycoside hydrolase catalytic domain [Phycisphaerae bacterium]